MLEGKGIIAGLLFALVLVPCLIYASVFTGEGAIYFDRGHYWIEIPISHSAGDSALAGGFLKDQFVIIDLNEEERSFFPSKIELIKTVSGRKVVVLSSGKLKGRRCYRVIFNSVDHGGFVIEPICDPFYYSADDSDSSKGFFERYIAPAFSTEGEYYRFNRLSYGYDLSSEKSVSEIEIKPSFGNDLFSLSPSFNYDRVVYDIDSSSRLETSRRGIGAELSSGLRVGKLKYITGVIYSHRREEKSESEKGLIYSQAVRAGITIRFDNFFDRINLDRRSVFKGADLSLGYAWFDSSGTDLWKSDSFRFDSPYLEGKITWTVFRGLQISFAERAFWPSSSGSRAQRLKRIRVRLLLRDMLDRPRGRAYHPDLEFGIDSGRRFPLFKNEERVFLGFTFDLYPW